MACNNAQDLREVIETQTGRDARNFEMPGTTIDQNGVLYAVWNDVPAAWVVVILTPPGFS